MTKRKAKGQIGSSFDDFLDEEGIREEIHDMERFKILVGFGAISPTHVGLPLLFHHFRHLLARASQPFLFASSQVL